MDHKLTHSPQQFLSLIVYESFSVNYILRLRCGYTHDLNGQVKYN